MSTSFPPIIHMFSTGKFRRALCVGFLLASPPFAMLSGAVSTALTDIALTRDPARKIAMATEARQNVTRWVAEHYGYRAEEVARMAGLFDDVVSETRAASGVKNFDLSLIANLAA